MFLALIGSVHAEPFGSGAFGAGAFGVGETEAPPSPPAQGGGGGGSGGVSCPSGQFALFGYCYAFSNLNIVRWFDRGEGALEYRLQTPRQAYLGQQITVTNTFQNEGQSPTEMRCLNFFDTNGDGVGDLKEPITYFTKLATPENTTRTLYNTTLVIPSDILPGDYLIGGECKLFDSTAPNATAGNKIKVVSSRAAATASAIIDYPAPFNLSWKEVLYIVGAVIALVLVLIYGLPHILAFFTWVFGLVGGFFGFILSFGLPGLALIILALLFGLYWLIRHLT